MKRKQILLFTLALVVVVAGSVLINRLIRHAHPALLQGVVECTTYRASSKIAGRIDRLMVSEGTQVRKGELLYTLTTPELDAKLRQAQALRTAAEALDEEAIRGARIEQIEAARSLVAKAEAGLTLARKSFERIRRLYDRGVVAAQRYDEVEAKYKAMQANVAAAQAEYDLALAGARSETKEVARAKVSEADGAVAEVTAYLADALVYAPSGGEVSTLAAEQGEVIGAGFPVVSIVDLSDCYALFNIRENLMPNITIGTRFAGYVPALDLTLSFRVSYIAPEADFAIWSATRSEGGFDLRTFEVKAVPLDTTAALRPGMSVLVDRKQIRQP